MRGRGARHSSRWRAAAAQRRGRSCARQRRRMRWAGGLNRCWRSRVSFTDSRRITGAIMKRMILTTLVLVLCAPITRAAEAPTTRPKPAAPASDTLTRVYDVRDLLMSIDDYPFDGRLGAPQDRPPIVVSSGGEA